VVKYSILVKNDFEREAVLIAVESAVYNVLRA
jgi:hypothetical protein